MGPDNTSFRLPYAVPLRLREKARPRVGSARLRGLHDEMSLKGTEARSRRPDAQSRLGDWKPRSP